MITSAKEARGARKLARISKLSSGRTNEPARECHESTITRCISGNEFRCQTRALRKTNDGNFPPLDSSFDGAINCVCHELEG